MALPTLPATAPGLRRPVVRIAAGGGPGDALAGAASALGAGADLWTESFVSVRMSTGTAPSVDSLDIVMDRGAAADLAPGDEFTISLGYADAEPVRVFTGAIDSIRLGLDGSVRITLLNAGATLARLRLRMSFERQLPGEIVRDLAGIAGVRTGSIESGALLAFFALDDGRGAWTTIADLALRCGFLAHIAPDGKLHFAAAGGSPVRTFRYGEDVLGYEFTRRSAAVGAVTVHGEGAAGSQGQDAWGWLIKDPAAVTAKAGQGGPERFLSDGALRSAEGAGKAASALLAAAAARRSTGRLLVPGAPGVTVGATVAVSAMPDAAMNGTFLVTGVRHDYRATHGFRTRLDLSAAPEGGGLPGGFL